MTIQLAGWISKVRDSSPPPPPHKKPRKESNSQVFAPFINSFGRLKEKKEEAECYQNPQDRLLEGEKLLKTTLQ